MPHLLLVDASDVDTVIAFHFHGHALGRMNLHRVAVPDIQHDAVSGRLHPVSYAHELQGAGVALGHSCNRVGDEAAGQAVQGAVEFSLAETLHNNFAVFDLDHHIGMIGLGQGTPGSRHGNLAVPDVHGHPVGERNGLAANAR